MLEQVLENVNKHDDGLTKVKKTCKYQHEWNNEVQREYLCTGKRCNELKSGVIILQNEVRFLRSVLRAKKKVT